MLHLDVRIVLAHAAMFSEECVLNMHTRVNLYHNVEVLRVCNLLLYFRMIWKMLQLQNISKAAGLGPASWTYYLYA